MSVPRIHKRSEHVLGMLRARPELTPRASQASVPTDQRQRLTSSRVLTTHVPEQTDSFILYIKAMVLLSKVKIFNLRFKSKFQSTQGAVDPRDTSAFKGLNSVISSFISSFPEQFREPIQNDVVDTHLYVAHLVPHAYVSPSIFFFVLYMETRVLMAVRVLRHTVLCYFCTTLTRTVGPAHMNGSQLLPTLFWI